MAINWGAALGAAFKTGLDTYERLGEEELREMQRSQLRKKIEGEKAYADALAEETKIRDFSKATQGQAVGQVAESALNFTPEQMAEFKAGLGKLSPEQQQNVLRAYAGTEYVKPAQAGETGAAIPDLANINVYKGAGDQALATTEKGEMRSQSDIYRGVVQRLAESGNPEQIKTALEMKNLTRQSEIDDKYDSLMKWRDKSLFDVKNTIQTKGLSGIPDVINPELKKQGLTAKFNEKTGAINIVDSKGKVVKAFTDTESAMQAASAAIGQEWTSRLEGLLGSADKALTYQLQREKNEIARKEAEDKGTYYRAAAVKMGREGSGGAGGAAKNFKMTTIETTDANGQKVKLPVSVGFSMVNGVPKVEAYTLNGEKLTDPKILNQLATGESAGGPASAFRAGAIARYQKGDSTFKELMQDLSEIDTFEKMTGGLPKPGEPLNPKGATGEKAVRTGKDRLADEKKALKKEQEIQVNKSKGLGYTQKLQD